MFRRLTGLVTSVAAASLLVLPMAASAASAADMSSSAARLAHSPESIAVALRCRAWMSNSHPKDYSTIYVRVRTVRYANVRTVAYYRTVTRTRYGRANRYGRAAIRYRISRATPGFRVNVRVNVGSGSRRGSCSTFFVPRA
ncbi:MAG TPA: hypothetical protein VNF47_24540 [Streptosporangiaceae bacterium]|nr:hypothetical protein [Streptosporangiaceae bacterium]